MKLSSCVAWLAMVANTSAELPWTRLDGLFPAGAKAGSTTQVRLTGGSELGGATSLWFSHPGISGRRVPGSSESDFVFEVAVAGDVPSGLFDVGVVGDLGLSNVRTFGVSQRDEATEVEPNETAGEANAAVMGTVLNGRIGRPTDVDAYRFRAGPGRKVIVDCLATRIDSPLLPVLEVLDARGRRIAFARSGRDEDAALVFEPTAEGEFALRVYDQTYRGGDHFVYRLELTTEPYVLSVQPVSGQPGSTTAATLLGFNLPEGKPSEQRWGRLGLEQATSELAFPPNPFTYDRVLPVSPREAAVDSFSWRLSESTQPVRVHLGEAASSREVEPNQVAEQAQKLTLPADVSGDFAAVGDIDVFSIDARKGEPLWIEVFADRLGSPADASLTVEFMPQENGELTKVATIDDSPTNLLPLGFETQSDDPQFRLEPPSDGRCVIRLRDQYGQTRGDATLTYRLVVRSPRPDFRLVAAPTSKGVGVIAPPALRCGDALEMTLLAFRREGFDGSIEVPGAQLGGGLSCDETWIPAGQTSAPLVIRAGEEATAEAAVIKIVGRASAPERDGRTLERPVRPATTIRSTSKVQTRNIPATSRLAREFVLGVAPELAPLELRQESSRQAAAQGRMILVPLKLIRRQGAEGPVTVTPQGLAKTAKIDAADVAFAAGETEKLARLFVRPDAPVQTVVFHWVGHSKVQYRRNAGEVQQSRLAVETASRNLETARHEVTAAKAETNEAELAVTNASMSTIDDAAALTQLQASLAKSVKRAQDAEMRLQQFEAAHADAEDRLKKLEQASPAKEFDAVAVTSPFIVDIEPAPAALDTGGTNDLTVQVGQSVAVPVKFTRKSGFEGPVVISLYAPALPTGLQAKAVTVSAEGTEAQLVIQAAPDTPAGVVENAVVSAQCGEVVVEAPILLKVLP